MSVTKLKKAEIIDTGCPKKCFFCVLLNNEMEKYITDIQ